MLMSPQSQRFEKPDKLMGIDRQEMSMDSFACACGY